MNRRTRSYYRSDSFPSMDEWRWSDRSDLGSLLEDLSWAEACLHVERDSFHAFDALLLRRAVASLRAGEGQLTR